MSTKFAKAAGRSGPAAKAQELEKMKEAGIGEEISSGDGAARPTSKKRKAADADSASGELSAGREIKKQRKMLFKQTENINKMFSKIMRKFLIHELRPEHIKARDAVAARIKSFTEGHPRWAWFLGKDSDDFFAKRDHVWRLFKNAIHNLIETTTLEESDPLHPTKILALVDAAAAAGPVLTGSKQNQKKKKRKLARMAAAAAAAGGAGADAGAVAGGSALSAPRAKKVFDEDDDRVSVASSTSDSDD
eukprot:Amastigsp_a180289_46.p1 type:complete len:248 gc:universal Amastigsp_a180289_46:863-120(-)